MPFDEEDFKEILGEDGSGEDFNSQFRDKVPVSLFMLKTIRSKSQFLSDSLNLANSLYKSLSQDNDGKNKEQLVNYIHKMQEESLSVLQQFD